MNYKQQTREFEAFFKVEGRGADRTVVATLSTTTPVETMRGSQILDHTYDAIDMSRFDLPILLNHLGGSMPAIGRAKNPRIVGNALKVDLHFGKSKQALETWGDIEDGTARHLSVGFVVLEETQPDHRGVYHVTRWQPLECSVVPIPADINAVIGRSATTQQNKNFFKGEEELKRIEQTKKYWQDQHDFRTFTEQLIAEQNFATIGEDDHRIRSSGLAESGDGHLVQQDFAVKLFSKGNISEIFERCLKIKLSNGNSIRLPRFDETDRTTDNLIRGMRWYYTEEGEAITASQFKVSMDQLQLKKMACLLYLTGELAEDSGAADVVIPAGSQLTLNRSVEDAVVDGPGHNQPLGILRASCTITVDPEGGQSANTILSENILKMLRHLPGESWQSPGLTWLVHKDTIPELSVLYKEVGTSGGGVSNLWHWRTGPEKFNQLCGVDVIVLDSCKPLGSRGDIILADLREYLIAYKESRQAISMHVKFVDDEQAFRILWRWDGMPSWSKAIDPASGSNKISPFITLAARS